MLEKNITHVSVTTSTMIRVAMVALGLFLLWYLRDLILVVMTSIVIASFVESSVPHFKKIGIGRVFGIVIVYVLAISTLLTLIYLFAPLLILELINFSSFASTHFPSLTFLSFFQTDAFSGAKDVVGTLSHNFSVTSLLQISKTFVQDPSGIFFIALSGAFGGILNFGLIILISFYLCVQDKGIENFLRLVFPIEYEDYIVDLWDRSSRKIALWMKGQMLLGLVIAVFIYLLLSLLGVEYALLFSLIAGIMELVPYGILVALIPAFAFSYLSGGATNALMVTGSYIIMHQFEVFLFAPLIIKKVVGLSPIVIILSVLVGFELGGFWGAILAIPVSIIVMEFINDVEKDKILARTTK